MGALEVPGGQDAAPWVQTNFQVNLCVRIYYLREVFKTQKVGRSFQLCDSRRREARGSMAQRACSELSALHSPAAPSKSGSPHLRVSLHCDELPLQG